MSRTRHARKSREDRADAVLFIRVPVVVRDRLRARVAEQRKRQPWAYVSLAGLVRELLMHALDVRDEDDEAVR